MTSTCQLSRNGSSKTLEEPFVKVEILRRDCPSRSPHFNPLRPCGRRLHLCDTALLTLMISIHSARVGGDLLPQLLRSLFPLISIHSARVGGDQQYPQESYQQYNFNPLRPCGRRRNFSFSRSDRLDFNPLRPCGRRLHFIVGVTVNADFNPLRPCGRRPKRPAVSVCP